MNDSLRRRYSFFLINYFMQGAIGIVYEPLDYILKDRLKLTPGQASGFIALMTFPLLLKPLFGFISDFVPIGGSRRKPHLLMSALIGSLAFGALFVQSEYRYSSLLFLMTLSVFALAFADAVCGGLLVEDGKERQQTGPYQALHIGALYLSAILVGTGGGWMTANLPFQWIFGLAALMPLVIMAAALFIHEPETPLAQPRATAPLWSFVRTKSFWLLSVTIVLWNFYPFLGTVQFYFQSNALRLNPQWIGSLMSIGSIAGLVGSAAYWKICQGRDANVWVLRGPLVMGCVSLTYLFYRGPVSVTVIEVLFGFSSVFFRLALLDLIARSCPADAEATCYALFLVLFDLAMFGSNALGGKLYDWLQKNMAATSFSHALPVVVLILIGSACTFACHWTLPVLKVEKLSA